MNIKCKEHKKYEKDCNNCKAAWSAHKDKELFFILIHNSTCGLLNGIPPGRFTESYDEMFPIVHDAATKKREEYLSAK